MSFDITASVYCQQDRNMNIDEGTTCATLRNILYAAGLDTHASVMRVFRGGKIYIGRMEGFVLKEGDHVEFRNSYDLVVEHDVTTKKTPEKKAPACSQHTVQHPTREELTKICNAIFDHFCIG